MVENFLDILSRYTNNISTKDRSLLNNYNQEEAVVKFIKRINEGCLTREENQLDHFCVYFAVHDPSKKQVFMGYHIDAGLWLFNGGHVEKGEHPRQTAEREMREELGISNYEIPQIPGLLTFSDIKSKNKLCKFHWEIWYFLAFDKDYFYPDQDRLRKEFYQAGWFSIEEAEKSVTNLSTQKALEFLKNY